MIPDRINPAATAKLVRNANASPYGSFSASTIAPNGRTARPTSQNTRALIAASSSNAPRLSQTT